MRFMMEVCVERRILWIHVFSEMKYDIYILLSFLLDFPPCHIYQDSYTHQLISVLYSLRNCYEYFPLLYGEFIIDIQT